LKKSTRENARRPKGNTVAVVRLEKEAACFETVVEEHSLRCVQEKSRKLHLVVIVAFSCDMIVRRRGLLQMQEYERQRSFSAKR